MEEVSMQGEVTAMDRLNNVVLDIESLTQPLEKCSGSPKMTKALSRKGSNRMERRNEEQENDEASKKLIVKVVGSQMELLKQPLMPNKAHLMLSTSANGPVLVDTGDSRNKRFHRLMIHPRQILLLFATVSSMGTMILIYFTLSMNRRGGD
ncbi:uncharacterized protein LOC120283675 isoform X1 [Dioscorea cayenensis subsp. rotundata]|uniref:Uncharacterized protein LOC120283675 isoform X1 n=2 Tax=Dioscorea cayennensis subsp. rotundata TaxID=55577 RepID=A0AB40D6I3_DIOCR|nr:uncharacterized protein LOC120283675 isoform X1 [Dioscorea cayenensis subsp. rotundata]XP_039146323.1 uncharacterized protein LOC120283675 isoform X1 [Dioscorea cayenensis subsp. rotundata]